MKITHLKIDGLQSIELPITNVTPSSPYIVKDVGGLGPSGFEISSSYSVTSGGRYFGRIAQTREIVARIELNPNYEAGETVEGLREKLYGVIQPKIHDGVFIYLMDGIDVKAYTIGVVKIFEIAPFGNENLVQITFTCFTPNFRAFEKTNVPITNPNLLTVNNTGQATVGFEARFDVLSAQSSFKIRQIIDGANWSQISLINVNLIAGDVIALATVPGNRSIQVLKKGALDSVPFLWALEGGSKWFGLPPGVSQISTQEGFSMKSFSYQQEYFGV